MLFRVPFQVLATNQRQPWQKKKRNRRNPCNRVRYNKHPSNNSNRRHSRCHKSRKARAIVTMRT